MSHPTISVRNLSKKYRLGDIGMTTLRDDLQRRWARFRRTGLTPEGGTARPAGRTDFWALRGVNFEVHPGEIVGLIGANGAGKSTLLKIISRITEPTAGEVRLRGRLASLLEVGTGFHQELSGRENIFLNGAVLGMSRAETSRKFDEIVEFSEIGNFIDTPVKRYSSGMYVRLAFAIAAHLDPEILIIDEVLAVGDQAFQRKCLSKVREISRSGNRTVLFVSHDMAAMENICTRAVMMRTGELVRDGTNVREIIRDYLAEKMKPTSGPSWQNEKKLYANEHFQVDRFFLASPNGQPISGMVSNDTPVTVVIEGEVLKRNENLQVGYGLFTDEMALLYWCTNLDSAEHARVEAEPGTTRFSSVIPARFLNEGKYRVGLFISIFNRSWICEPGKTGPALALEIRGGLSDSRVLATRRAGLLCPILQWKVESTAAVTV
jgi:lipopolysaccharide transport system ATP-binding protein